MNMVLLQNGDFISEGVAEISGNRARHIIDVHRAVPGKELCAGLLNSKMGRCTVLDISADKVRMSVCLDTSPPEPLDMVLIVALPRPKSLKKVIHVSTSLGIKKIYVIETWKVDKSYWKSPVLGKDEIDEHVYSGLEQGKDTVQPEVIFRRRFKPFVEDELPEIIKNRTALVAHPYGAQPVLTATGRSVVLAVGPEGGFTDYEVGMFKSCGFTAVSAGDRIQRVEFAIPLLVGKLF